MISLEAYRAAIGIFYRTHLSHGLKKLTSIVEPFPNSNLCILWYLFDAKMQLILFFVISCMYFLRSLRAREISNPDQILGLMCSFESVLSCIIVVNNMSFLKHMFLLRSGDVESNPGPTYNISKVVQASCHQGHPKFGHSAGIQCASCSLVSICWARFKLPSLWRSSDLDTILEQGTKIFEQTGLDRSLSAPDLSRIISVGNVDFRVTYAASVPIEIKRHSPFLLQLFKLNSKNDGLLLFTDQMTMSLVWNTKFFFLFDSHSINKDGFLDPDQGTAVCLKFSSIRHVENYLNDRFLISRESLLGQLEFVSLELLDNSASEQSKHQMLLKMKKGTETFKKECRNKLMAQEMKRDAKQGTKEHTQELMARRINEKMKRDAKQGSEEHVQELMVRKMKRDAKQGTGGTHTGTNGSKN